MKGENKLNSKNWSRRMTLHERLYRIGEKINTPFAMQFIIKGKGLLDENDLQQQIDKLAESIPFLRLKSAGSKWSINGNRPKLIVHHSSFPTNLNESIFHSPMHADAGNCFEFHLFQSEHSTLLFRVLHSATDGKGALKIIEYLFALLNQKKIPAEIDYPKVTDVQHAVLKKNTLRAGGYKNKWKNILVETGSHNPALFKFELIEFNHRIDDSTATLIKWFMHQTLDFSRFLIPVNIRRHGNYENAVSNLSLPIFLESSPEQSIEEIQTHLLKELAAKSELSVDYLERAAAFLPDFLLTKILRRSVRKAHQVNKYPLSGYISDLGFIDLGQYATLSFRATDIISLPVYVSLAPFCVVVCSHANGTSLGFSIPIQLNASILKQGLQSIISERGQTQVIKLSNQQQSEAYVSEIISCWAEILKIRTEEIGISDQFTNLGGDSINLLFIIDAMEKKYKIKNKTSFMQEVLNYAGSITIQIMSGIISKYQSKL